MMAPTLNPELVNVTAHAVERYCGRRSTTDPMAGIQRLLARAARQPTPPLRIGGQHRAHRKVYAGGFTLIFDAEMRTLITLWRA